MSQTKNQHFISQAEQRLNASNPSAPTRSQRIYEFQVVERDKQILALTNKRGRLIERNLSKLDLFSFEVDEGGVVRSNFEAAFGRYEGRVRPLTDAILAGATAMRRDLADDLIDLFVAKMINFIRNPYSVKKVLNTFARFAEIHPTDPAIYRVYEKTLTGRQPHQSYLCEILDITEMEYRTWLRVLFMLLTPIMPGGRNFLEDTLIGLVTQQDYAAIVHVRTYDEERCLLCDRGVSSPIDQSEFLAFDFNLTSTSFIRFIFPPYALVLTQPMPEAIRASLARGPKLVQMDFQHNDLRSLEVFHRRVIEQAFSTVYCSGPSPFGATVRF